MTMYYTGTDFVDIPPTIEIFEPPDDRYFPGYKITDNVDGDVKIYGPRLKDLNVPFSLYGLPIPITFGVRRLYGNIIWARPLKESKKKKKNGGGKGGGPEKKTVTYQYYATFAVAFGIPGNTDSTARDIIRMWANGSLVYDRRGTGAVKWPNLEFKFYKGEATQPVDPLIESFEGAGQVPAYRDVMYIVFRDMPISDFGNYIPAISVEIGDATTATYTIRNIETDAGNTFRTSQDFGLWDSERMEYYAIRGGAGGTARIWTYSTSGAAFLGSALINNGDGVGYTNNVASPTLGGYTGMATSLGSYAYIPWKNLVIGKPNNITIAQPLFCFDPTSGVVTHWVGIVSNTIGYTNAEFPLNTPEIDGYFAGVLPQWETAVPFQVYGLTEIETYLMVSTTYSDLVLLKFDVFDRLDFVWYANGVGGVVTKMCALEPIYNQTKFAYAVGANIYQRTISYGARRTGTNEADTTGVGDASLLWTAPNTVQAMYYYFPDNSLIVFHGTSILSASCAATKLDLTNNTEVWTVTVGELDGLDTEHTALNEISSGTISWVNNSGAVSELDFVWGQFTLYSASDNQWYADDKFYDGRNNSIVGYCNASNSGTTGSTTKGIDYACSRLFYNRIGDSRMDLADFILGLALYAGYDAADIDISTDIDDQIDGAIITQITSFKAVMQSICVAYRLEMFESGGKIKFTRRAVGATSTSFAVTEDDLVRSQETSAPEEPTFVMRREEERTVPQKVSLRYIDKSLQYQWNMASVARSSFISTNQSDEQLSLELPIIMTAAEAKAICNRVLWQAWNSRVSYSFRLDWSWAKIEPGDYGTITVDSRIYTVRAVTVTYNTDFSISIQGVNAISDETVTVVADAGGVDEDSIPGPTSSEVFILDVPLIQDTDNLSYSGTIFPLYYYLGPLSYEQSWAGATLYMSTDGTAYSEVSQNVQTGLVCVVANLPDYQDSWMTWDETNTFTVFPKQGDKDLLLSATTNEVLAGTNLAAYGKNGRWELISFRDVTDNGDGSFTLAGILRGVRGTDFQLDTHKVGDYLVLIDDLYVNATSLSFNLIDTAVSFKPVGFGQLITNIAKRQETIYGYGALPWPPHGLRAARDISDATGDITLSWIPRGRAGGPLRDNIEDYELTEYDVNDYKLTIYRWPHYDTWNYSGGTWVGTDTGVDPDFIEIEVTGATSYVLTATEIRAGELYEFSAPDNLTDAMSAFSQHGGAYMITENETANEQIVALGYGEFVAFKYLDIMIQQKTTVGNTSGYGPGRVVRVYIEDTQ